MDEKILISKSKMHAIGDAIRYMLSEETTYLADEMPDAIKSILPNLQEKTVDTNGDYTPDGGYDGFSAFHVRVPSGVPTLEELVVDTNGVYMPPEGVDGFFKVTVNVSGGAGTPRCNQVSTFDWANVQLGWGFDDVYPVT